MFTRKDKEWLKAYILNEFKKSGSPMHLYMMSSLGDSDNSAWVQSRVLTSAAAKMDIEVVSHVADDDSDWFDVFFNDVKGRTHEEWNEYELRVFDVTEPSNDYKRFFESIYFNNREIFIVVSEFVMAPYINGSVSSDVVDSFGCSINLDTGYTYYTGKNLAHDREALKNFLAKCGDIVPEPHLYYPFRMTPRRRDMFNAFLEFNSVNPDKAGKIMDILSENYEAEEGVPIEHIGKALWNLLSKK